MAFDTQPKPRPHRTQLIAAQAASLELPRDNGAFEISPEEFTIITNGLLRASEEFVDRAAEQICRNTRNESGQTNTPTERVKITFAHRDLGRSKGAILADKQSMQMVDTALTSTASKVNLFCTGFPMKIFNPLETDYQGDLVELGDMSALLRFSELARILNIVGAGTEKKFMVTVVSDGNMNHGMFNVETKVCESYVNNLRATIGGLAITNTVSVKEFFSMLPQTDSRYEFYIRQLLENIAACHNIFDECFDADNIEQSIGHALELEHANFGSSSFRDLFYSSTGSVRYRNLEEFSQEHGFDFAHVYSVVLHSILSEQEGSLSAQAQKVPALLDGAGIARLRAQRTITATQAWHSTVEYFAVMQAANKTAILNSFFSDSIRVTTRPKPGQIGIHTSDQQSPTLFSYHSVAAIVPCNKARNVKVDFIPRYNALKNGFRAVVLAGIGPMFYLPPHINREDLASLPWKRGGS